MKLKSAYERIGDFLTRMEYNATVSYIFFFLWTIILFGFGLCIGLWIGLVCSQWRLNDYILHHPIYQYEEAMKVLGKAAAQVGDKYEEADRRLGIAAEQIDRRFSELDRLSQGLNRRIDNATREGLNGPAVFHVETPYP